MSCRLPALVLGAALLATAGCRSSNSCGGSRPGLFTSNNNNHPPCTLVGSGTRMMEGCYDPITGQPVPCPPQTSVIPGGGFAVPPGGTARPDELPFPAPSNLIPSPGVPYAVPGPAPGVGLNSDPKGNVTAVKPPTKQ